MAGWTSERRIEALGHPAQGRPHARLAAELEAELRGVGGAGVELRLEVRGGAGVDPGVRGAGLAQRVGEVVPVDARTGAERGEDLQVVDVAAEAEGGEDEVGALEERRERRARAAAAIASSAWGPAKSAGALS